MEKLKKIRRILALLSVVFIVVLIIVMLVCAVTGSKYFWAALFFVFMVPFVLWVFLWFSGVVRKKAEEDEDEENATR